MLSERAKALRPVVRAAFDAGGLDAICELIAAFLAMKQAADDARQRGRKHIPPATAASTAST